MPIKPYRGSSRERLTAIINAQNLTPRVDGVDFEYGPPEIWSGPINSNTRVILTPLPPNVYIGPWPITYKRLPIGALLLLPVEEKRNLVVQDFPFSTHSILAEINDAYGLNLAEDEVEDIAYEGDPATVTLRILDGNYAWMPSEVQLPVNYIYDVNDVISNPLDGFDNPPLVDVNDILANPLDGFDNPPLIDVADIISNPLDGFDNPALFDVNDILANPLPGFDNPDYVPELGFAYLINGFYEDDSLFIDDTLDGFSSVEL